MSAATISSQQSPLEHSERALDQLIGSLSQTNQSDGDGGTENLLHNLEGETTKKEFAKEILRLTEHALSIDSSFRKVSTQLGEFITLPGQSQEFKAEVTDRKARWDRKRQEYIDLLWESRNTAVRARAVAIDFADEFMEMLKDGDMTLDKKKVEIAKYKQKLNEDQKKAEKVSQGFLTIREWVEDFKAKFSELGNIVKTVNVEAEKIGKLDTLISKLEASLASMDRKLSRFLLAFRVTLGISGASLLAFVCPHSWTRVAINSSAGLAQSSDMLRFTSARASAERQLENTRSERAMLQTVKDPVIVFREALQELNKEAESIASKLAAFSYVWAMIVADLGEIETKMELLEITEYEKFFNKRLRTVAVLYRSLSNVLYQYATTVTKDPLFKDRSKEA